MPLFYYRSGSGSPPRPPDLLKELSVRSRLDIVIRNSGVLDFIKEHFQEADIRTNIDNQGDWRESEVFEWPNDNPNDPHITYEASQISLRAISERDYAGLSVLISFEYDVLGNHKMKIEGHEVTFEGQMPEDFSQNTEQIEEITSALIQAMMRPKEIRPDEEA